MTFHVDQKVVCVKATPWDFPDGYDGSSRCPQHREVFTVAQIDDYPEGAYLELREIPNTRDGKTPVWHATCFRPVKTTDIGVFRAMLAPSPKQPARVD